MSKGIVYLKPGNPERPYMVEISAPFDEMLHHRLKADVPGCVYAPDIRKGAWAGPIEAQSSIMKIAKELGYDVVNRLESTAQPRGLKQLNEKLYPFQFEAAQRLVHERALMINFATGLGKTPTAIEAIRLINAKTALIICPAMVRATWERELNRWWPGNPGVSRILSGEEAKKASTPFVVCSYDLVKQLPARQWDAIIVDESHYIMTAKAARSKAVKLLMYNQPQALKAALTATPITNQPHNLWNQLDALWPERFGSYFRFVKKYCLVGQNDYSDFVIEGLNSEFAGELQDRLRAVSFRVTQDDVAGIMPPFVVTSVPLDTARRRFNQRELLEDFMSANLHNIKNEGLVAAAGKEKIEGACDYVENALAGGDIRHVVVLTHLKKSAEAIARSMRKKGANVFKMDGEDSPDKRNEIIQEALKHENSVLICTMHSVREGINELVGFDLAVFAEIYYTPGVMVQVLGRFHRINGTCPVAILCHGGTHEEIVAAKLAEKLQDAGQLLNRADGEKGLTYALGCDMSDEQFMEDIKNVCAGMLKEDVYL